MEKRKLLRVVVPVLIVLLILGVWAIKNYGNNDDTPQASVGADSENDDFSLNAESIDLEKLSSYGMPVIIDFGAGYCQPCREFEPILESMHDEMSGKAIIKYVDTELYPDIASNFPVTVIPTQVFINPDGTPYQPSDSIDVQFSLYQNKSSGEHVFTTHEGGLTEEQLRSILIDMGVSE